MMRIRCLSLVVLLCLLALLLPSVSFAQSADPYADETPAERDARMKWWREARFGMFIHWGVYSVPAGTYNGKPIDGVGEWIMFFGEIPVAEYREYAKQFNPVKYDPDQWVRLAKEAGMKYIVITAKHHDGFALFDSKVTDWDVVDATPYGKDLLKPLAEACRKHGIKLGFYYSQAQDWFYPGGSAAKGKQWDPAQKGDMDTFHRKIVVPQLREILTNYGDIAVMWWDTSIGMNKERADRLLPLLELQPGIIHNNRLARDDYECDYSTHENYVPATGLGHDWETCMTMNNTWGFKSYDDDWKSTEELIRNIIDIVSKGGNYLLNVGPTALGEIPAPSIERLKVIGAWMDANGESIYGTTASPFENLPWGRCSKKLHQNGASLYLHVFEWPTDGKLLVPGLKNAVKTARLLDGGKVLETASSHNSIVISLPKRAPDSVASVVVVDVEGPLDIVPVGQFKAVGPTEPTKVPPFTKGAVEVFFESQPTSLRFNMPSYPCMVTENNIQYVTFGTETYDPRIGRKSFEPQQDKDNTYNRIWIESQNEARIIVRLRGALCNREDKVAHTDIPSGSPYGKGDWVDEWFYIYPDGTHTRHAKIYTGLTQQSLPFGYNRRPPNVIYEFMEAAVWGQPGHLPTDDVETEALTLVKLVGGYTENMLHQGQSKTISFKPYPKDFGDFRDAHIMVINLKSQYKPFVIASPFGARAQPYVVDWKPKRAFVAWEMEDYGEPPEDFFITELGHLINYTHYRRTDNTLEQIYLQGMTNASDPVKDVVPLAWSWIAPPRLEMEGLEPSYDTIYDPAQKAYIVPRKGLGPVNLEFELDDYSYEAPLRIVNPAFVIKNWGDSDVVVKVDGKRLEHGKDFRAGYEETPSGFDLVLWLKMKSTEPAKFSISPVNK